MASAGLQGKGVTWEGLSRKLDAQGGGPGAERLRGHVGQPSYLSVEDVQSLPNVVHEVLRRVADLRAEATSLSPVTTQSL